MYHNYFILRELVFSRQLAGDEQQAEEDGESNCWRKGRQRWWARAAAAFQEQGSSNINFSYSSSYLCSPSVSPLTFATLPTSRKHPPWKERFDLLLPLFQFHLHKHCQHSTRTIISSTETLVDFHQFLCEGEKRVDVRKTYLSKHQHSDADLDQWWIL